MDIWYDLLPNGNIDPNSVVVIGTVSSLAGFWQPDPMATVNVSSNGQIITAQHTGTYSWGIKVGDNSLAVPRNFVINGYFDQRTGQGGGNAIPEIFADWIPRNGL